MSDIVLYLMLYELFGVLMVVLILSYIDPITRFLFGKKDTPDFIVGISMVILWPIYLLMGGIVALNKLMRVKRRSK